MPILQYYKIDFVELAIARFRIKPALSLLNGAGMTVLLTFETAPYESVIDISYLELFILPKQNT
jgi:hypothetical protein